MGKIPTFCPYSTYFDKYRKAFRSLFAINVNYSANIEF